MGLDGKIRAVLIGPPGAGKGTQVSAASVSGDMLHV